MRLTRLCAAALAALALAACADAAPTTEPTTRAVSAAAADTTAATATEPPPPPPTVTPAITATPLPAAPTPTHGVPTPLPAGARDYELCVSVASDSNGYGHVSFLVPDPAQEPPPVAITYITPLWVPLEAHLNALGLDYLDVRDRSLSAGGLTIASSNYLESGQYARLKEDRCKFVVITPFYPDVAVDLATPEYYIENLEWMVDGLVKASPASRLLVLNYYQTARADFSVSNSGRGLRDERIAAFNDALAAACTDPGSIGGVEQVTCVDIRPFFEGMGIAHVLGETTKADFEATLYRENGYTTVITDFFEQHPDATITGDGIHLSQAGRDRLAEGVARVILDLTGGF